MHMTSPLLHRHKEPTRGSAHKSLCVVSWSLGLSVTCLSCLGNEGKAAASGCLILPDSYSRIRGAGRASRLKDFETLILGCCGGVNVVCCDLTGVRMCKFAFQRLATAFSGVMLLAWLSAGLHIRGFGYLHTDRTGSCRTLQGGPAV
jgi:hypothetical protein